MAERGTIETRHLARCGRCGETAQSATNKLPAFKARLIQLGWLRVRRSGWVCPTCAETGEG